MAALIRKMQQQLDSLEEKIDTLIQQSSERQPQERQFSKPYRPYGHSHRPGEGRRDHGPRERNFPPGRHFDRPQGEGRRGNSPREGGFSQGRHFDKRQGGENRGFGPRRKKF